MDPQQIYLLLTGSGGALVAMLLWNRSLLAALAAKEKTISEKDAQLMSQAGQISTLLHDVARSMAEGTACKYRPDGK